eukprot:jgi/Chrzof1/12807/Cz07g08070.t1
MHISAAAHRASGISKSYMALAIHAGRDNTVLQPTTSTVSSVQCMNAVWCSHFTCMPQHFGGEDIDPDTATLWFAGKQMLPDKKLLDFVGKNDRSKVVVKLQKKGQGAPAREPPVDADTQKAMLAWYYKKQQEQKELAGNEDDSYINSTWADTKTLKQHFSGVHDVRIPR